MKQDEIIEMAKQAGGLAVKDYVELTYKELEAFAKLVEERTEARTAAKERADEREACAKVCEDLDAHRQVATWYSQAIRARGEQHE